MVFKLSAVFVYWTFVIVQLSWARTLRDCENQLPSHLRKHLCPIRRFEQVEDDIMERHMQCAFNALHFTDTQAKVMASNIVDALNGANSQVDHKENLKKCVEQMPPKPVQRARSLFNCLLKSSSAQALKDNFDFGEIKADGKVDSNTAIDKGLIEQHIKAINDRICGEGKAK